MLVPGEATAGFDHELPLDQSGIWARKVQTGLEVGAIATELAAAAWLGNDDALGHTFWQSIDSSAVSGIASALLKRGFARARPSQGGDPHQWFKGSCCQSFPSGEVTLQASIVTPFIATYGRESPWVWTLEALPAYDAVARLKSQAHWQSDVIAGWLLGSAVGYWAAARSTPVFVEILPRSMTIGFYKRF